MIKGPKRGKGRPDVALMLIVHLINFKYVIYVAQKKRFR